MVKCSSVWNNTIIDGHNRYEIAQKHGLEYTTAEYQFDNENDAILWIINQQFGRRNLPAFVRGELAERYRAVVAEKAKEKSMANLKQNDRVCNVAHSGNTNTELSQKSGISERQQAKVKTIVESAIEPIKEMARREDISVNQAEKAAKLSPEIQKRIVPLLEKGETVDGALSIVESPRIVKPKESSPHMVVRMNFKAKYYVNIGILPVAFSGFLNKS